LVKPALIEIGAMITKHINGSLEVVLEGPNDSSELQVALMVNVN